MAANPEGNLKLFHEWIQVSMPRQVTQQRGIDLDVQLVLFTNDAHFACHHPRWQLHDNHGIPQYVLWVCLLHIDFLASFSIYASTSPKQELCMLLKGYMCRELFVSVSTINYLLLVWNKHTNWFPCLDNVTPTPRQHLFPRLDLHFH